jgi:hypothetical protein
VIERRERYVAALGQFEIGGVIERQSMASRQGKDIGFLRLWSIKQPHTRKARERVGGSFFVATAATFRNEHGISQFKPPMRRNESVFKFDPPQCLGGIGMVFVGKEPTCGYRRVKNERHLFPPLVAPSQYLFPGDAGHALSHFLDFRNRLFDFTLSLFAARQQRRDLFSVPCDYDGLAAFHLIEELGKAGLGFRGLHMFHQF